MSPRITLGLAIGVSVAAVAVVVLVVGAIFPGSASLGTQPASAAVLRGAAAALGPKPGTILAEKLRVTGTWNHGPRTTFDVLQAFQTPNGPGSQDMLYVTGQPGPPDEMAVSGGNEEVYLRATDTIYVTSNWGLSITKGSRPRTYLHIPPKPPAGLSATLPPMSLPLTATQAEALRDGTAQVLAIPTGRRVPFHVRLELVPAVHFPSETATIRRLLEAHLLKVEGTITIGGRTAIKLAGPRFDAKLPQLDGGDAGVEYYVDPETYAPIKEVVKRLPLLQLSQTRTEDATLPITSANERLLSLAARHPTAKVDHNRSDYLRAVNGVG